LSTCSSIFQWVPQQHVILFDIFCSTLSIDGQNLGFTYWTMFGMNIFILGSSQSFKTVFGDASMEKAQWKNK
jgi:hypothetical protein